MISKRGAFPTVGAPAAQVAAGESAEQILRGRTRLARRSARSRWFGFTAQGRRSADRQRKHVFAPLLHENKAFAVAL